MVMRRSRRPRAPDAPAGRAGEGDAIGRETVRITCRPHRGPRLAGRCCTRTTVGAQVDDDLIAWIATLRERVERGEFAGRGPVSFDRWAPGLPLEQFIRVMLADLDGWEGL